MSRCYCGENKKSYERLCWKCEEKIENEKIKMSEEKLKRTGLIIMTMYEFISKDAGYVIEQLHTDDWFERFSEHFLKFKNVVNKTEMSQNDRDSCDLIIDSYEEYGLSDIFMEDFKTAFLINETMIKGFKEIQFN